MKTLATRLAVIVIGSSMITGVIAAPVMAACSADSGYFCAYDGPHYDSLLMKSAAGAGTDFVDVEDNKTESVKNATNNWWCGVEAQGWPDHTILEVPHDTNYATLDVGDRNQIDHFYVRSQASGCD